MKEKNIMNEIEMFNEHARDFKQVMINCLKDVFEKMKTDFEKNGKTDIFNNLFAHSYEETLRIEQKDFSFDDLDFLMNEHNFLKSIKERLEEKMTL